MEEKTNWIINNKTGRKIYLAIELNQKMSAILMAVSFNKRKLQTAYPHREQYYIEPSKALKMEALASKIKVEFFYEQNETINVTQKTGDNFELVEITQPQPPPPKLLN